MDALCSLVRLGSEGKVRPRVSILAKYAQDLINCKGYRTVAVWLHYLEPRSQAQHKSLGMRLRYLVLAVHVVEIPVSQISSWNVDVTSPFWSSDCLFLTCSILTGFTTVHWAAKYSRGGHIYNAGACVTPPLSLFSPLSFLLSFTCMYCYDLPPSSSLHTIMLLVIDTLVSYIHVHFVCSVHT